MNEAIQSVKDREVMGAIWIPANYTDALDLRIDDAFTADNDTVDESTIRVYLDNSIFLYGIEFFNVLIESFSNFAKAIFKEKDLNGAEIPFDIQMTSAS